MATEQDEKNAPIISVEEEETEPLSADKVNGLTQVGETQKEKTKEEEEEDEKQVELVKEVENKTNKNDIKKDIEKSQESSEDEEEIIIEVEEEEEEELEEKDQTKVEQVEKIIEEVKEIEPKILEEKSVVPENKSEPVTEQNSSESDVKIDAENIVTENVKSSATTTTTTTTITNDNKMNEEPNDVEEIPKTTTATTTTNMADDELPKFKEQQPQQLPSIDTTTATTITTTIENKENEEKEVVNLIKDDKRDEKVVLERNVEISEEKQQQPEEIQINVKTFEKQQRAENKATEETNEKINNNNNNNNYNNNVKDCVDATERYAQQQFPLATSTKTAYGKVNWSTPTTATTTNKLPYDQQPQQQPHQYVPQQQPQQYVPQSQPQQYVPQSQQHQQQQQQYYVPQQQKTLSFDENEESSNFTKNVDLQKIFTPATDAEFISPKNRVLYASSAFYSPSLHPTVEDQVELARRISHSLSDISNHQSKGQSMYVNRKKRSVKWIHEGGQEFNVEEREEVEEEESEERATAKDAEELKENSTTTGKQYEKLPLKLIMNPRGQVRDIFSLKETINTQGLLSPQKCHELVMALQEHKGRGAELFAKRRKKAENWIVEATTTNSASTTNISKQNELSVEIEKNLSLNEIADYQQQQQQQQLNYGGQQFKPSTSPNLLPAYSDVGKHRVQLNLHQEQLLQKYVKPELRVVKTPWEAALETGSASTAFVEQSKPIGSPSSLSTTPIQQQKARSVTPTPYYQKLPQQQPIRQQPPQQFDNTYNNDNNNISGDRKFHLPKAEQQQQPQFKSNYQRDLAYKPNLAQGWKSSSVNLPTVVELKLQQEEHKRKCEEILNEIREKSGERDYEEFQPYDNNDHDNSFNIDVNKNSGIKIYEEVQPKQLKQQKEEAAIEKEKEDKNIEKEQRRNYNNLSKRQQQQQQQQQEQQENSVFIEHFVRSPELRLSPIPMNNLWAYDKTVQQLNQFQHQQQQQPQHHHHIKRLKHQEEHIELMDKEMEELIAEEMKYERQQQCQQESNENIENKKNENKLIIEDENQNEKDDENNKEEYVKIAVGELISAFERHAKLEKEKFKKQQDNYNLYHHIENEKSDNEIKQQQHHHQQHKEQQPFSYEAHYRQQQKTHLISNNNNDNNNNNKYRDENLADLFIPKEIPLESYAPPPAMPAVLTKPLSPYGQTVNSNKSMGNWNPSAHTESVNNWAESQKIEPRPMTKRIDQQQPPFNYYQQQEQLKQELPKQQYLPETSYQKVVKPINPLAAPVNFSPSPLAQQKLAKFEEPSRNWSPNNINYNNKARYGATQIVSPPPQYAASPPNQYQRAQTPSKSLRVTSDAPNFNNAARGWQKQQATHQAPNRHCGATYGSGYANISAKSIPIQKSGWGAADDYSLPYTDF